MRKKIIIILSVVILVSGIYFCNGLFGNPVTKALVTKSAKEYVAEKYVADGYAVESVNYDFKTSSYYVDVRCADSLDKHFTLYGGFDGKIGVDTYESDVEKKWNTAGRICDEYIDAANTFLHSGKLPYKLTIAFGEIEFADGDYGEGEIVPDYAIELNSLTLDGEYGIYETGKSAGCLTVYVEDNEVSAEKLSEILLKLRETADKEKFTFRAVNCVLQYPMDENYESKEGIVEVMRFAYEDIYEEGLVERVKKADKMVKKYYDAEDELKYLGDY